MRKVAFKFKEFTAHDNQVLDVQLVNFKNEVVYLAGDVFVLLLIWVFAADFEEFLLVFVDDFLKEVVAF